MSCGYFNLLAVASLVGCDHCALYNTAEAVHRYYESRRRQVNDQKPSRIAAVKETKRNAQKKSYRKQVILLKLYKLCHIIADFWCIVV